MPTFLLSGGTLNPDPDTGLPRILTSPLSGTSKPEISRRRVVLPLPLGPRIERISPGLSSTSTSLTGEGVAEPLGQSYALYDGLGHTATTFHHYVVRDPGA